jgi:amidohydrolase
MDAAAVLAPLDAVLPPTLEVYRDLHRHPEVSGDEVRTAARFGDELADAGLDVTRGVGGHGVVGVLGNGEGPTVLLRAELDALPIEERTQLGYASETPDVMHACGHDAHASALIAAAGLLIRGTKRWRGTVVVVGQPAEETLAGARAMLADGLYTRFPRPDVVLAQHVAPFPAGGIVHSVGMVLPAGHTLDLILHARGGHPGMTHSAAANPIDIAATVVQRLHDLNKPGELLVTVGAFHAGLRANIVPETARLSISLRAYSSARLATAVADIEGLARKASRAAGADEPEVEFVSRAPSTFNDPCYGRAVRAGHTALFGARSVSAPPSSMATEDFALFGPAGAGLYQGPPIPAVYWSVGSVGPERWESAPGDSFVRKLATLPPNHSPRFAPDPGPTLRAAAAAITAAALSCLTKGRIHS